MSSAEPSQPYFAQHVAVAETSPRLAWLQGYYTYASHSAVMSPLSSLWVVLRAAAGHSSHQGPEGLCGFLGELGVLLSWTLQTGDREGAHTEVFHYCWWVGSVLKPGEISTILKTGFVFQARTANESWSVSSILKFFNPFQFTRREQWGKYKERECPNCLKGAEELWMEWKPLQEVSADVIYIDSWHMHSTPEAFRLIVHVHIHFTKFVLFPQACQLSWHNKMNVSASCSI